MMEKLIIRLLTNQQNDVINTWFNPVLKNYKDGSVSKEETELEGFYVYNVVVEKLKCIKYGYKIFSGLCNNIPEKTYIYIYGADEELHEWDVDKRVKVSTSCVVDPTDISEDIDYMIFLKNEEVEASKK